MRDVKLYEAVKHSETTELKIVDLKRLIQSIGDVCRSNFGAVFMEALTAKAHDETGSQNISEDTTVILDVLLNVYYMIKNRPLLNSIRFYFTYCGRHGILKTSTTIC